MTTDQQVCSRCFKSKPLDVFGKFKTCDVCRKYNREYLRNYYKQEVPTKKNPALKEYFAKYYKDNKEEMKQKAKDNWKRKRKSLITFLKLFPLDTHKRFMYFLNPLRLCLCLLWSSLL